jgi:hypothetical protein
VVCLQAERSLCETRESIEKMRGKFADVLRYFGEDPEMPPQAFFTTLEAFMRVRQAGSVGIR